MHALHGGAGHAVALRGRTGVGGRLHGLFDADDRVAHPWAPGPRPGEGPPRHAGTDRGGALPRRLLDRSDPPSYPRSLACPRQARGRILRDEGLSVQTRLFAASAESASRTTRCAAVAVIP